MRRIPSGCRRRCGWFGTGSGLISDPSTVRLSYDGFMKPWKLALLAVCIVLAGAVFTVLLYASRQTPPIRRPEVVRADLMAALAAFEAQRYPRPPLFEPATEGTAADHYRDAVEVAVRAREDMEPDSADEADLALSEWPGPPEPVPDAARRFLPVATILAAALRRGACTAEAGQLTHVRAGLLGPDEEWLPIWNAGRVGSLARLHAAVLAESGRMAEAVNEWLVLGRFGADFGNGGDVIARRLGVFIQTRVIEDLADLSEAGLLGAAERQTLRSHLESWWADAADRGQIVRAENLWFQRAHQQIADGEPGSAEAREDFCPEGNRADIYRIVDLVNWAAERIPDSAEEDLIRYETLIAEESSRMARFIALSGRPLTGAMYSGMSKMWTMRFGRMEDELRILQARKAGLLIALDILDYRDEHGNLPGSLEDLPVRRTVGPHLGIRLDAAAGELEIAIRDSMIVTVVGKPEDPEADVFFRLPPR